MSSLRKLTVPASDSLLHSARVTRERRQSYRQSLAAWSARTVSQCLQAEQKSGYIQGSVDSCRSLSEVSG
jgi:hypothetical protein